MEVAECEAFRAMINDFIADCQEDMGICPYQVRIKSVSSPSEVCGGLGFF